MNVRNKLVVIHGKQFKPSLMFADKVRHIPMSRVPERYSTLIGSGFTLKDWTSLEKLARSKHYNL
jgi:hypothetical protein